MVRIILLMILLVVTSACSKTTFVRSAPNYLQELTRDKTVALLPPNIEVDQVGVFGKKTRMHNYEDRLEDHVIDAFVSTMQDKGYKVRVLTRSELAAKKLSNDIVDTKDDFNEVLKKLYAGGAWKEDKAYSIDQKIPATIEIGKQIDTDLLALVNVYGEYKTSGAMTMSVITNALLSSSSNASPSEVLVARVAIINLKNGQVLWANSVSSSKDWFKTTIDSFSDSNKADKASVTTLFTCTLSDLPEPQ